MPVAPGQQLQHYRLLEKIGEGGMGAVWKATDTKLDRDVAIKLLPEHLSADPERLGRFEREAKLLASLNHRNIASIYGLEQAEGARFLVMEYAEGEDLAQRLARGRLPVREALDAALQLARALESAHEAGVLHRDLKPANVRVSDDGRVKVLDFGLAKAFEADPAAPGNPAMSPTLTSAGSTQAGVILGTAAYMSPEQARGKPLDKRTDIWAFGCVLYECLTGRSPFLGETITDTLASVVKKQADWSALPAETPPRVLELLQRCLEKEVRNRLRDIGDARLELQRALAQDESSADSGVIPAATVPGVERRPRAWIVWLAVAALVGAAAGIGLWNAWPGAGLAQRGAGGSARFSIIFPDELNVDGWLLSPNGDSVAFRGRPKGDPTAEPAVYLRSFDTSTSRKVEGSDGARSFAFSPDGRWLAMHTPVAPRATKSRLAKVPVDGSAPPLAVLEWSDDWGDPLYWMPDGDLIVPAKGNAFLVRIPADGSSPGEPVRVRLDGAESRFFIGPVPTAVLPDGRHALGTVVEYSARGYANHVGVIDVDRGEAKVLVRNGFSPAWSRTGHLVFTRRDAVLAVAFDLRQLQTTGETVAVEAGLRAFAGWGHADFQLSADGTLLHWPGGTYGDKRRIVIGDFVDDRLQVVEAWSDELRQYEAQLEVSLDGRRLAINVANDAALYDIWIAEMDRPRLSRFVHEPGQDCLPAYWTRDGESLIYKCETTTESTVYVARVDGSEAPRKLVTARHPEDFWPSDVFPDDSTLVLNHADGQRLHLALLPLTAGDASVEPQRWLDRAWDAAISPDGRWLAYESDSSGRTEIYLRSIRSDRSLGREIPVTTDGGDDPWWYPHKNGSVLRLQYAGLERIYSVDLTTEPEPRLSRPETLGSFRELSDQVAIVDHLPDGRFMLVMRGEGEQTPGRVEVVLNWTAELERRMRR